MKRKNSSGQKVDNINSINLSILQQLKEKYKGEEYKK